MSLLNSYICPTCGNYFPLFLKPSITVRRGLFSTPYLKCQQCGQLSRPTIDFKSALISWPVVVLYMGLVYYAVRTDFFQDIYRNALWLYLCLVFIFFLMPLFLGIRRGLKLVKVQDDKEIKKTRLRKWLLIIGIALFLGLFGYYTNSWSNVIIGIVVAVIVYLVFNRFRQEK